MSLSTLAFMAFVKGVGRLALGPDDYARLTDRMNFMRLRNLQEQFPELWEQFTAQVSELKDRWTDSADPEVVASSLVPGAITNRPELFEYFRQRWYDLPAAETVLEAGASASLVDSSAIGDLATASGEAVLAGAGDVVADGAADAGGSVIEFIFDLFS